MEKLSSIKGRNNAKIKQTQKILQDKNNSQLALIVDTDIIRKLEANVLLGSRQEKKKLKMLVS